MREPEKQETTSPARHPTVWGSSIGLAAALAGIALLGLPDPQIRRLPKPSPPIEIETDFSADPSGSFRISARASSPLAAEMDLEILLPEGTALTAGPRFVRSRKPELRAEGWIPRSAPPQLFVRASLAAGNARLERVVSVGPSSPIPPKGTLKTNSRGETIREFGP